MNPKWLQKKLIKPEDIEETLVLLRKDQRIATLNGSFDLLHAGHLYMISEAKKQADLLIVLLNTDESIQKYKDAARPIIPLQYRLEMMAALEFVDYVSYFHETDPCRILEKIKPDVHVNGEEYGRDCIESKMLKKIGSRLHLVKRIPHLSTSEIIEKITCVKSVH